MTLKLLQELLAGGFISEKEFEELKKGLGKSLKREEEFLLERQKIDEQVLFELKSRVMGIPLKKVKTEEIPSEVLELLPEEASINYRMAAINKYDNVVEVGMVYPEDIEAQNALRFWGRQQNLSYKIYLITLTNLEEILRQRKSIALETRKVLEALEKEKGELFDTLTQKMPTGTIEEEAPIIKMVLVILKHAIEGNASDIHIEPRKDKLTVRFRLNGILYPSLFLPLKVHSPIVTRIKILSGLRIDETRIPQDGRFSMTINNTEIDFRVATFPTLYGEKVEIRVLNPLTGLKPFEELGLKGRNLEIVKETLKAPHGLILSTGPTGSGKTTTQYAILQMLNKDSVNIVTIEDPIEYSIPGVNQSQIKPEIGYTFATGLRQILRQDPNIIMIGEIRDEETASLVVNAALTGHLVLSTLHTHSSVGVIPRLMDLGVKGFLIPSTLRLVISQKLVRVLCPYCKVRIKPSPKTRQELLNKIKSLPFSLRPDLREIKEKLNTEESLFVYKSNGCEKCNFSGYSGRTGLFEVLFMTDQLAKIIQENPLESLILKTAQQQGMLTMEQEGVLKVLEGETSLEEIARVVEEKE